jgi:hypothetical protein
MKEVTVVDVEAARKVCRKAFRVADGMAVGMVPRIYW